MACLPSSLPLHRPAIQPSEFRCAPPCGRSFPDGRTLALHRTNTPACAARFLAFVYQLAARPRTRPTSPSNNPPLDQPIDSLDIGVEGDNMSDVSTVRDELRSPLAPSLAEVSIPATPHGDQSLASVQMEIFHEEAGKILRVIEAPFLSHAKSLKSVFKPFANEEEWLLAVWLQESGLSRRKMNLYFKLPQVRSFVVPTFML
jgi:hypothetical protein